MTVHDSRHEAQATDMAVGERTVRGGSAMTVLHGGVS